MIALALGVMAGCGDDGVAPLSEPPRVIEVSVSGGGSPIVRTLTVELEGDGGVVVDYWTDEGPRLRVQHETLRSRHEVVVSRLRAERIYRFEVRGLSEAGARGRGRGGEFVTDPLPDDFRDLEVAAVGLPTSPLTLVEPLQAGSPFSPFVLDGEGHVVWFRQGRGGSFGSTLLAEGVYVFSTLTGLEVVDTRNQVLARLDAAAAAAETGIDPFTIHHDVVGTPESTVLMLVNDTTLVNDTVWTGEAIWEWNPVSGSLEKRWASKEVLDPRTDRGPRSVPEDWLHANSLAIGPRGNVLISLFWLHEVLSVAPDFRSLEWRLGGPASSFEIEDDAMQAGQHTAAEVASNRILMFDNGRDRSAGLFSRALEMELDPRTGNARVAWQFRPTPDIYAPIVSSAYRLDNGNTVVGFGTSEGFFEGSTGPIAVFEVTPSNRVLWKLEIVSGLDMMYRATPLSTLGGEVAISPHAPAVADAGFP